MRRAAALLLLSLAGAEVRHAIIVTGHLRSANDTVENIRTFVWAHNARRVDVFYHLWVNSSDACHNATVRALAAVAVDVTHEPAQCQASPSPLARAQGAQPPSSDGEDAVGSGGGGAVAFACCGRGGRGGRSAREQEEGEGGRHH